MGEEAGRPKGLVCSRKAGVRDAFAFLLLTSRSDPRRLRRVELAHRVARPCAPFWNSLSHGWRQLCFFGQFQLSYPAGSQVNEAKV